MKEKHQLISGPELFLIFFKIGCFTFGGGWSILAQMEQEFVDKRKLITKAELLEMVAVGKSVPGIMITNISLLFGYHVSGAFGALCTVFGITCPAFFMLSLIAVFYDKIKDNYWCGAALKGIRSAVIPIIGSAVLSLGKDALKDRTAVVIMLIGLIFAVLGVSNIMLVLASAACALIWHAAGKRTARRSSKEDRP